MEGANTRGKGAFFLPMLGALLLFIILWRSDFPKPMCDDLFYTGAGLNMAAGEDFSNPFLVRQGFPSHFFFVYPPLHSYAVYGWLILFGISATSLLAFQNLMYFIISACMILVLRRHHAREFLLWLVPLGVTAVFLRSGLRPEAFAVALTMAGYTLLIYTRKSGFQLWVSLMLMLMGGGAAPRTAFFAIALAGIGSWQWMQKASTGFTWKRFSIVAGLACLATLAANWTLIDFRTSEFIETFRRHASRVEGSKLALFKIFMTNVGNRWWPIFGLTLVTLIIDARRKATEVSLLCRGLALVFLLGALGGSLGHGSTWYIIFILLLLAAASLKDLLSLQNKLLAGALVAILLLANSTKMLEAFGMMTGKIHDLPSENRAEITALRSTPEQPLLVDAEVARYAFDYRLPKGCIDFEFAAPFPGFLATDAKLQDRDLYLVGPSQCKLLNQVAHLDYPIVQWTALGIKNWSYFQFPRQTFVIPARICLQKMAGGTNPDNRQQLQ